MKKVGPDLEEIKKINEDPDFEPVKRTTPISFDRVVSTGSTLLDLAISGERIRGGGVPGGMLVEIFGDESTGKSAILAELCTSAQRSGGAAEVADPEGRFSDEFARMYGVDFSAGMYSRPRTVPAMFSKLDTFLKKVVPGHDGISVFGADSLAALSTDMELEKGDKMGMRRAKEFSEGLRVHHIRVADSIRGLFVATNQVREGDGPTSQTPGGRAVRFYSSLRIRLKRGYPSWQVKRKVKLESGAEVTEVIGIISTAEVVKSSISSPFKTAPLYIEFGYGVDDVRANLQWLKDMLGGTMYGFGEGKGTKAVSMVDAIWNIEGRPHPDTGKLQNKPCVKELRGKVIDLWEEIQHEMKVLRSPKER